MNLERIFKAYDIRGVYPDDIDEDAAHRIGWAFATFLEAEAVLVGRDMRPSSPTLAEAFAGGVREAGADSVDLGLVSTDAAYFAAGRHDRPTAMFTASHNPGAYNGVKLSRAGAGPVGRDTGLAEIRELAEGGVRAVDAPGQARSLDVLEEFVEHLLGLVDVEEMRPFTVAVDAANGMGGKVVPLVFERLPVRLVPLYFELDGTFPNHPADPIQPENLVDLQECVRSEGADVGMAFDGDADRVFLVDERAELVSGSLLTALVAARILEKHPGETIIHNAICSRVVAEVIEAGGGKAVRSQVGHSFIKALMAETSALFAGEHSGHYYFRDNFRADSGLLAALYVLEAMSASDAPLSEVVAPLRRYAASGEVNSQVDDQEGTLERVAEAYSDADQDRLDGLTVSYPDWWFNLRPSNTEPLLRLNVEAETTELMEEKRDEILAMIRGS